MRKTIDTRTASLLFALALTFALAFALAFAPSLLGGCGLGAGERGAGGGGA